MTKEQFDEAVPAKKVKLTGRTPAMIRPAVAGEVVATYFEVPA